jgi:uncharacterized protein YqeY
MLKQQIQADAKEALKQGNQLTLAVLRMAISTIGSKEKDKRYKISKEKPEMKEEELIQEAQLSDEEVLNSLSSEIKKRKDAIELYEKGGRPELAAKEKEEITILQKYLPEQLSTDQLRKLIEAAIKETGATSVKEMGKVMGILTPKIKGKADNKEVSNIIKELLQ